MIYLPWLYYKDSHGHMRQWRVGYEGSEYWTQHGAVDGVIQDSAATQCYPTNEGKINARSADEQAAFEADALREHKRTRRYRDTVEEADKELFLPMLANKFKGRENKVVYPVYVQPKLDGVRCLAYWAGDKVALMSRVGKPYDVPHIPEELAKWLPVDMVLDGELYIHGVSAQTITSLVRGQHDKSQIEYHIYDAPIVCGKDDWGFARRVSKFLEAYWESLQYCTKVQAVPNFNARSSIEVEHFHNEFVTQGYEGAMVRVANGPYKFGRRSNDLLKVKVFLDEEFVVVDWKDGEGKLADCCVFQCRDNKSDALFWCMPKGTIQEREEYARDARSYVGRKLTVRFFERTDDGIPRFPVGICFRDEKDMPDEATEN